MSTKKFAKYYEDGEYYEVKVGGAVADKFLVQFVGYEDDDDISEVATHHHHYPPCGSVCVIFFPGF